MSTLIDLGLQNALLCVPLALVALVVTKLVHKPALAHALWLIVILKLVTPPIVHLPILPPTQATAPAPIPSDATGTFEPLSREDDPVGFAPELDAALDNAVIEAGVECPAPADLAPPARPETPIDQPAPPRPEFDPRAALFAGWIAGSILLFGVAALRVIRLVRLLRAPVTAGSELRGHVTALATELGLKRAPKVIEVPGRFTPFVWALGPWSVLAIPSDLWDRLDAQQRTALLLHELAHLRRRDPWVRWLEAVATGLYWWHPALWLARRGLHQAEEQCCDAWVVWARPKAARSYASALVDALEFLSESPSGRPLAPLGASGLGRLNLITQRITLIMNGNVSRRLSWSGQSLVLALAAIGLALVPTRAEPRPATRALQPAPAAIPAPVEPIQDAPKVADDPLSDLRDAVELAQSQVQIKQALIKRAKAQGDQARASLTRFKRLIGVNPGYASDDEIAKANAAIEEADANLTIAEAELQEALIRVKQAQRRLDRAAASNQTNPQEQPKDAPTQRPGVDVRATTQEQLVGRNLREIALAMHQYMNKNEHFPSVAIRSANGTPLLSWRVAILPFMGHEDLFAQFHLDEPWDGPHNKTLIEKMPRQFAASSKHPGMTDIRGVVAKECFFDPDAAKGRALTDITDGTSNTIMCVANFTEMPWTQPETAQNAEPLGSMFPAVFADGAVRRFEVNEANKSKFKALATISGGEQIDFDNFLVQKKYVKDSQLIGDELNKLKADISRQHAERKAAVLEQYTRAKQSASDAAERARTMNSLKQIGIALHTYADANGRLPAVSIRDKDGKALLSWRVAILPYLDQNDLYRQFHLDEPWDSEHNKTLIEKMPSVYQPIANRPGMTGTRGVVGPNCFFDPKAPEGRTFASITDGTSNTIACVADFSETPWTKPEDTSDARPTGQEFSALLADGSVRLLAISDANKPKLEALVTVAGGEVVNLDEFNPPRAETNSTPAGRSENSSSRARTVNNLKQIGIALHNYADVNGRLPAAAIHGKDGKPLLSWRVAILPYLEQDALYRQFHLDEPWDSEHNKTLIAKMPKVYGDSPDGFASVNGIYTPGAVFDPSRKDGLRFADVLDGTSNTVAAAIAESQIHFWTRPDMAGAALVLRNPYLALFLDGSVQTVNTGDENVRKALLTAAGGEVIDRSQITAHPNPPDSDVAAMMAAMDGGGGQGDVMVRMMQGIQGGRAELIRAQQRIAQLEAELAALRDEIAKLRAK